MTNVPYDSETGRTTNGAYFTNANGPGRGALRPASGGRSLSSKRSTSRCRSGWRRRSAGLMAALPCGPCSSTAPTCRVIEPWPGQLSRDPGLLPLRQLDQRVGLTRAFTQALDDPRDADPTRVLLSRTSAQPSWQQNGNNIGRVNPTWLQRHWQKSGDVTVCHTSNLNVNPTCFQRHVDGRRTGL